MDKEAKQVYKVIIIAAWNFRTSLHYSYNYIVIIKQHDSLEQSHLKVITIISMEYNNDSFQLTAWSHKESNKSLVFFFF